MQGGAVPPPPHATMYQTQMVNYGPAPSAPPMPSHQVGVAVAVGTPSPYQSFNYDNHNLQQPAAAGGHPQQQQGFLHPPAPGVPAGPPPMHYPQPPQAAFAEQGQQVVTTPAEFHATPISHERVWGKM